MFLTDFVLWPINQSKRTQSRLPAKDLLPENEGKGHSPAVTVCHVDMNASRTMHPSHTIAKAGVRRGGRAGFVNADPQRRGNKIGSQQKCPSRYRASRTGRIRVHNGLQDGRAVASLRPKDDNLTAGRDGRTTFGDSGRQKFEGPGGGSSGDWQTRQRAAFIDHPPEDKRGWALAVITSRTAVRMTHSRGLIRSGNPGGKSSGNTTKNDKSQNRHLDRYFGEGMAGSGCTRAAR